MIPIEKIEQSILLIRGKKVMLDRDITDLYGVETKILNRAVRRNIKRFTEDFMFALTRDEIMRISQLVPSSEIKYSKKVHAFTEQGVAMLSSILNSKRAIELNTAIMQAFVVMRKMLFSHVELARKLEEMEMKYDEQLKIVFEAIRQLTSPPEKPKTNVRR